MQLIRLVPDRIQVVEKGEKLFKIDAAGRIFVDHVEVVPARRLVAGVADVVQGCGQFLEVDQSVLVDVERNVLCAKVQNLLLIPSRKLLTEFWDVFGIEHALGHLDFLPFLPDIFEEGLYGFVEGVFGGDGLSFPFSGAREIGRVLIINRRLLNRICRE